MSVYCRFYISTALYIDFYHGWGFKGSMFAAPSPFFGCGSVVVFSVGIIDSFRLWSCEFGSGSVRGRERFWARTRGGTGGKSTQLCGV